MSLVQIVVLTFPSQAVAVTPFGSLAVVPAFVSDRVQFVAVSPIGALTNLGSLPSGDGPINVGISPNGNIAIVTHTFDGGVSVYDLNALSRAQTIDLAPTLALRANQSVVFSPDGSNAYVYDVEEPNNVSGTISVLAIDASDNVTDTGTRIIVEDAPNFFGVDQLAIAPTGADLYVRSTAGFQVVDTSTNTIKTAFVPLPGFTQGGGVATVCPSSVLITADTNQDIMLQPGESAIIGPGVQVNGNLQGDPTNIVVIGADSSVNGNIEGIGTLVIDGANVFINGNYVAAVSDVRVAAAGSVTFNGNITVADLTVESAGAVTILGNLDFSGVLTLEEGASLVVIGNLACAQGASSDIDPSATINVGGNDTCPVTP